MRALPLGLVCAVVASMGCTRSKPTAEKVLVGVVKCDDSLQRAPACVPPTAAELKTYSELRALDEKRSVREQAASEPVEQLTRLDARVTALKARVDTLSPAARRGYSEAFDDLKLARESTFATISGIRDESIEVADSIKAADESLLKFERSVNVLDERVGAGREI